MILLGFLLPRPGRAPTNQSSLTNVAPRTATANAAALEHTRRPSRMSGSEPIPDAQKVVAGKVCRFAENRLGLVHAMAMKYKIEVPGDVERFFAAVNAGHWSDLTKGPI